MSLTLANVEFIIVKRTEAWLAKASMAVTVTGAAGQNADLTDPIGYGIEQAGGTLLSRVLLVDIDVASVPSANENKMLDIAELRTLQNIAGNLILVDVEIGERDEKLGQLQDALAKHIERKEKQVEDLYQFGLPPLTVGVVALDFAEHDVDNIDSEGN